MGRGSCQALPVQAALPEPIQCREPCLPFQCRQPCLCPSSAGSPDRAPAAVGSAQPHGDTHATMGLWGPTTRHSNFSTNSLAGIWGRRLPCRRRQPAASGRAPTTQTPGEICRGGSCMRTQPGAASQLMAKHWQQEHSAGPEARQDYSWRGRHSQRSEQPCVLPQVHAEPILCPPLPLENRDLSKTWSKMLHSENLV